MPLSRRGKMWSYTDARYQPPPPYVAADPYEPFCIAAVELAAEKMVVMGQVVPGVGVDELTIGTEVELVARRRSTRTTTTSTWCGSGGRSPADRGRRRG